MSIHIGNNYGDNGLSIVGHSYFTIIFMKVQFMSNEETNKVTLDLPDECVFMLMQEAHALDITFNEHMNNILRTFLKDTLNEKN